MTEPSTRNWSAHDGARRNGPPGPVSGAAGLPVCMPAVLDPGPSSLWGQKGPLAHRWLHLQVVGHQASSQWSEFCRRVAGICLHLLPSWLGWGRPWWAQPAQRMQTGGGGQGGCVGWERVWFFSCRFRERRRCSDPRFQAPGSPLSAEAQPCGLGGQRRVPACPTWPFPGAPSGAWLTVAAL